MLRQLIWVCLQALKADLVPYLLKLLEGIGLENLESPSATKAQIVKTLKSMSRSLQYGEQVSTDRSLTGRCTLGRSNSEYPLFNLMADVHHST